METCSALLAICAGNSPVTGEFPAQRPVTRNFDVFFDLHLNERLSKQSWGWWFETPSSPLWRHCNVLKWIFVSKRVPVLFDDFSLVLRSAVLGYVPYGRNWPGSSIIKNFSHLCGTTLYLPFSSAATSLCSMYNTTKNTSNHFTDLETDLKWVNSSLAMIRSAIPIMLITWRRHDMEIPIYLPIVMIYRRIPIKRTINRGLFCFLFCFVFIVSLKKFWTNSRAASD